MLRFGRFVTLGAVSFAVAACTPISPIERGWVALNKQDPFTDVQYCDVTYGIKGNSAFMGGAYVAQHPGQIYPIVRITSQREMVGFTSINRASNGMNYTFPVGDVRMRVDNNNARMILVSETPVGISESFSRLAKQNAEAFKSAGVSQQHYQKTYEYMAQSMSPIVVSTGRKARDILEEFSEGENLIYQQATINNQNIGSIPLKGFSARYDECKRMIR